MYRALYPPDPAPGYYAISVNLIQGRNLVDPDAYAWFRSREPVDKVGYSIFIYHVPAHGEGQATLCLSEVHLSDVRLQEYAWLGTNDVRPLWFDARRAVVAPDDTNVFLALADDAPLHPTLDAWLGIETADCRPSLTRHGRAYRLCAMSPRERLLARVEAFAGNAPAWHLPAIQFAPGDPANHGQRLTYPVRFSNRVELSAYEMDLGSSGVATLHPGETLTLVTYWHVLEPGREPLQLFVHLLDAASTYSGGEDRVDVWPGAWQEGDLYAQVQQVMLDADAAPGEYQVEIGWYNPETMQRLPVLHGDTAIADRVLLRPVEVRP
jgi:hypothetical protein